MRLNAVYPRLHFWLGSALVALMDAPPLIFSLATCTSHAFCHEHPEKYTCAYARQSAQHMQTNAAYPIAGSFISGAASPPSRLSGAHS